MTKKTRQRLRGLLEPKRAFRSMATASDYGRHALDLSLEEVMPEGPGRGNYRRRPVLDLSSSTPVEKPGVRADDEFHVRKKKVMSRSDLLTGLKYLIDAALAGSGAVNSDDDEPNLGALSESAGLTLDEYESVTMRSDGLKWGEIAKAQGISVSRARRAADRGFAKLRDFVLN